MNHFSRLRLYELLYYYYCLFLSLISVSSVIECESLFDVCEYTSNKSVCEMNIFMCKRSVVNRWKPLRVFPKKSNQRCSIGP